MKRGGTAAPAQRKGERPGAVPVFGQPFGRSAEAGEKRLRKLAPSAMAGAAGRQSRLRPMGAAIRYLSLCSGIEAASAAWRHLGWTPVAFSEIEPFPCAVLAHHFPDVPNLGDMTAINAAELAGKVDLLVAGTPCQAFSIAGSRRGLSDSRGNLALEFVEMANAIKPAFILWENVPGVLSMRDNSFGRFLGGLAGSGGPLQRARGAWTDAGYVAGPSRAIAWRVLDAQYFGLAQRRRRVFVVACPVGGANPAEILFEWEGLRRDSPPRREEGQEAAGTLKGGSGSRGYPNGAEDAAAGYFQASHWNGGPHPTLQSYGKGSGGIGASDQELFSQGGAGLAWAPEIVGQALSAKWSKGSSGPAGDEHHNLVCQPNPVSGALCGSGAGMDRVAGQGNEADRLVLAAQQGGAEIGSGLCPAIAAAAGQSGNNQPVLCESHAQARRLMPIECERLQGFPDNWTDVPFRGKPAADGPRYKAIGNSMAVNVMRWIGARIDRAWRLGASARPARGRSKGAEAMEERR